jgi:hypothetical protein
MKNRIEFEDGMFILGCLDYGHGSMTIEGLGGLVDRCLYIQCIRGRNPER